MTLTQDEVIEILRLVEQSTFDELHLETGELKLVLRKQGCGTAVVESSEPASSVPAPSHAAGVLSGKAEKRVTKSHVGKGKKATAAVQQEGLVPINAPLLGTVYRRPAPDAPPYVEMGSLVKEDDTVCLIEVMKVFSAVKAGIRGRIAEVLVETNEMVEYGQPLFMVKPGEEPA
ncbi:MAG TPA: biotin/lipoyl-containing protein [Syntrophorhabdales bacterium]|nr:biotin/lipoyl-containing protein [Syntrophorhabdales bacterium]